MLCYMPYVDKDEEKDLKNNENKLIMRKDVIKR